MERIIEFINVNKYFGDRAVYTEPLSFEISKGDKFALLGQSGAGKSTALNIIMGFVQVDEGNVIFDKMDKSVTSISKFRQKCAWIPQSFNFLKGMSVEDTIYSPFKFELNKDIKPEKSEIIQYFEKLNLNKELLKSEISDLSGGERQRICAMIALLLKRDIIILDEPTSNLDLANSNEIMELFFNTNKTVIISTHENNVSNKCNKIIELL